MSIIQNNENGRYRPIPMDTVPGASAAGQHPRPADNWPYNNHPSTPDSPQYGIRNPKFEHHIFISRDQILFDIEAQISIMAKARRKQDGTEDDAITSATQNYQQQFYRWIDKHIGIAKAKMQAFVLEKQRTTKMNSISQQEEVDIELLMPHWWDDTVFGQLCQAVHDYVVNATLYEYFSIALLVPTRYGLTADPATTVKQQAMAENLMEIKKLANASKPETIRKHLSPF